VQHEKIEDYVSSRDCGFPATVANIHMQFQEGATARSFRLCDGGGSSSPPRRKNQHCLDCCDAHSISEMGHLRPSCTIAADGSLSPDSFRVRRMLVAEEMAE